jgi:hypothetical protein
VFSVSEGQLYSQSSNGLEYYKYAWYFSGTSINAAIEIYLRNASPENKNQEIASTLGNTSQ